MYGIVPKQHLGKNLSLRIPPVGRIKRKTINYVSNQRHKKRIKQLTKDGSKDVTAKIYK